MPRKFIPQRKNANKHTQRGLKELENSIQRDGWIGAITVTADGETFDGSARLETLANVMPDKEPIVIDVDGHTPVVVRRTDIPNADDPRAKRLAVAANRIAQVDLDWDASVLADLAQQEGDLLAGLFNDDELAELIGQGEAKEETADAGELVDKAAQLQEKWQVQRGDVWEIGKHRLMCGDSTSAEDVATLMQGERAAMVFTDPPYNVAYQDNESIESLKKRNRRTDGLVVSNDSMSDEEFDNFLFLVLSEFPLREGGAFYLCAPPGRTETQFRNALERVSGLTLRQCIVWVKDVFVFGRQDYHWRHESILYGWKDGASHYFVDDHTQDTVWEIERPRSSKEHPTMKPIALAVKAISNSSKTSDTVFDGFNGSGTTLVACEQTGRIGRGMEIEPKYCSVTLERLSLLGLTPKRQ